MTAKRGAKISVRQIKSGIGFEQSQKATLKALGLGKLNRVRVYDDCPQIRGMLNKVTHLVSVTEVDS